MSAWRRRALELFPKIGCDSPETTIYTVFFDLLPLCRQAHAANDEELLGRIYGFADWCFRQRAGELSNAAAVAFYEHLADAETTLAEFSRRVQPDVFHCVAPLLADRAGQARIQRLRAEYEERACSDSSQHRRRG